jgi:hypothetical protein
VRRNISIAAHNPGGGYSFLARSRSRNFWIFPVDVFGISSKTTERGTL